ncbi:SDR family NAD(P)-dependent oxidoreductase [Sphingobium sp. CR2-8]|uniref:SDR family NAD(P)-dependent oxidoreductase n=1 Tax=Sphingobium sp. CR2-8 TaxID=1306534 RepID=UPI002DBB8CCC|nr:SDR family NAD(P)-dependent oxidoreductase [Sphingobium sp. CR2-8]MEC3909525.1 SDR family NAD(P)-dependent oxidoreductase [Sphingobium sp. CR2-8]
MILGSDIAAVVTGGASGLGEATARRLAGHGVKVALFDLDRDRGEALAAELGGIFCPVDVSSALSVDEGFAAARAAIGQERILVNCAGIGSGKARTASRDRETGAITTHSLESFERIVQINLLGTFRCITKSAAGMMTLAPLADGDRGVIINTASVAAEDGQVGQVGYAASKAGVVGMTLPIARDLAREAIRINTILPGLFSTPMFARASEEFKAKLSATVPFPPRLGLPQEFAQLAETMITCGYFNGEDVRLDGAIRMAPR